MPQPATRRRFTRLGRPVGAMAMVQGVLLLLPDSPPRRSQPRPPLWAALNARSMARRLSRAGRQDALVSHLVRHADAGQCRVEATQRAADEVVQHYGDVPICLIGAGTGARTALRAAGHPAVHSVVALAPWLPDAEGDPVAQLSGRQVLIVHGTNDQRADPELSYRLASRARKTAPRLCRFEVHSDGHGLREHRPEVLALVTDFVLGALCERGFARPLTDAMAAPPPLGLRMPLAAGFGRARR